MAFTIPSRPQFVKLLMDVIIDKKITPYVVIQSFDKRTIQLIHQKYPQVRTSYLVNNKKSFGGKYRRIRLQALYL